MKDRAWLVPLKSALFELREATFQLNEWLKLIEDPPRETCERADEAFKALRDLLQRNIPGIQGLQSSCSLDVAVRSSVEGNHSTYAFVDATAFAGEAGESVPGTTTLYPRLHPDKAPDLYIIDGQNGVSYFPLEGPKAPEG